VGEGVPILKEASAWIGEELSELKLRQGSAAWISTSWPRVPKHGIREPKNCACKASALHLRSCKATVGGSVANDLAVFAANLNHAGECGLRP
jgi:hypothetical protein